MTEPTKELLTPQGIFETVKQVLRASIDDIDPVKTIHIDDDLKKDLGAGGCDYVDAYARLTRIFPLLRSTPPFSQETTETVRDICKLIAKPYNVKCPEWETSTMTSA